MEIIVETHKNVYGENDRTTVNIQKGYALHSNGLSKDYYVITNFLVQDPITGEYAMKTAEEVSFGSYSNNAENYFHDLIRKY